MKLNTTLNYINQALNYPSLTYEDISLYFNMAIVELNTTLHISLPKVSDMLVEFERKLSKDANSKVKIVSAPENNDYEILSYTTTEDSERAKITVPQPKYYYNWETGKFYVLNRFTGNYDASDELDGVYIKDVEDKQVPVFYKAMVTADDVFWTKYLEDPILECDLAPYLPDEWVLLWLIPYVCFKYTVRDGGTATVFADELTQGFQQLQESYDIPSTILLATYADKEAYTEIVEQALPNLNIHIPTRAIYTSMKHARNMNAVYGSMYDRGGFND